MKLRGSAILLLVSAATSVSCVTAENVKTGVVPSAVDLL